MVKFNSQAKYIVVVRNPKDCVVSFYHHTRGFPQHYHFEDGDFNVYFNLFRDGNVDFGCYYEMTRSWFELRQKDNVLLLTYENIVSNKEKAIKQIAHFLDAKLVSKLEDNGGKLMKIILHHSSLESMKKDPLRWCSQRQEQFTPFIRNGKSGDWMTSLSEEQVKVLDAKTREYFTPKELEDLGEKY